MQIFLILILAQVRSAIGTLEYWNDGILGFGEMLKCVIDKKHIEKKVQGYCK